MVLDISEEKTSLNIDDIKSECNSEPDCIGYRVTGIKGLGEKLWNNSTVNYQYQKIYGFEGVIEVDKMTCQSANEFMPKNILEMIVRCRYKLFLSDLEFKKHRAIRGAINVCCSSKKDFVTGDRSCSQRCICQDQQ